MFMLSFLLGLVATSPLLADTWVRSSQVKKNYGQPVKNAHEFVCAEDAGTGTQEFRLRLSPEVDASFVAASDLIGNAGGPFYVLIPEKSGGFRVRGCVHAHPSAIEVLKTSHHGLSDLKTYLRNGAAGGQIEIWEFNGTNYFRKSSVKIKTRDFEKSINPSAVKLGESRECAD